MCTGTRPLSIQIGFPAVLPPGWTCKHRQRGRGGAGSTDKFVTRASTSKINKSGFSIISQRHVSTHKIRPFCCRGPAQLRAAKTYAEPKLSGSRTPVYASNISQSLAPIGEADFARLRRHSRRIAARNFCKSEIRLTGNRDCAPAAAAYDANLPAAPPNSR
jgi:hypothetical protein